MSILFCRNIGIAKWRLTGTTLEGKKIEVIIRGDHNSEFNAVQRVMRLSVEAGISDVSLAALQMAEEGG